MVDNPLPKGTTHNGATKAPANTARTNLYSLFTDGASRGNPGHAGCGVSLCSADGTEIAGLSSYIGQCTNNVAEYKALILGLEHALVLGCSKLAVHLDSELIVQQVKGAYKVKNAALKPLHARVITLLGQFSFWTILHIPRAENARADALANQGIDNRS
ncbi:MAG: ribonuclease H [Desulfobulbus propionicus]|nr:MAG: ribonuclease H [Desulfobulbus propionicus]